MSVITSQMVESMSRKGDSIKVGESWYKAWEPAKSGLDKVTRGDVVSFTYITKDTPSGTFYNIKGMVEVESHGVAPAGGGTGYTASKTTVRKGFPIDALDGQRSIIRQNCMSHATRVVIDTTTNTALSKVSGTEIAELIIEVARKFEEYATGDLDYEEAKAKAEATLSKEDAFSEAA